jgi:hypothetical protein
LLLDFRVLMGSLLAKKHRIILTRRAIFLGLILPGRPINPGVLSLKALDLVSRA